MQQYAPFIDTTDNKTEFSPPIDFEHFDLIAV